MILKKLFSIILLALLFVGGFGLPSGLVVCYGADGHIAIETGEMDCNDTLNQADHAQTNKHQLTASHCGNCTDIPLILQSSKTATPEPANLPLNIQPVFLAAGWETPLYTFLKTVTEGQLPQPPPHIDPFLKAHRTIVLLI